MRKKNKRHNKNQYASVFAPLFRNNSTTPRTTTDVVGVGSAAGSSLSAVGSAGDEGIKQSKLKTIHEIRRCLSEAPDPTWTGYSNTSLINYPMRQGGTVIGGPGYGPEIEPGQGGKFNFQNSPGLGFGTEAAWRLWREAINVMTLNPNLPVSSVIQTAMYRSGVKYTQIGTSEMRLVEMGVEWYLSDPGRNIQKDSDSFPGGVPALQFVR